MFVLIIPWYTPLPAQTDPSHGRYVTHLVLLLVVMNGFTFLVYWHYIMACKTSPGHVPSDWDPTVLLNMTNINHRKMDEQEMISINRIPDSNTTIATLSTIANTVETMDTRRESYISPSRGRYCKKCHLPKPPRAHHCSVCKKCVLKMDHHCPWIANCVGFYNLGHFMRFLLSVEVTCSMYFYLCVYRLILYIGTLPSGPATGWERTQLMIAVINTLLFGIIVLTVGAISIQHMYYIAGNRTLIEALELENLKRRVSYLRRQRHPQALLLMAQAKFPYDLGIVRNFKAVFGPHIWNIIIPHLPEGNGLLYPVIDGTSPSAAYQWPPKLDPDGNVVPIYNPNNENNPFPEPKHEADMNIEASAISAQSYNPFSKSLVKVRRDSEGYIISSRSPDAIWSPVSLPHSNPIPGFIATHDIRHTRDVDPRTIESAQQIMPDKATNK